MYHNLNTRNVDHISKIMSKSRGSTAENFTIFFSNVGKTESLPEFKFERFQMVIFWRLYIVNIYIVIANASDFK